MKLLSEDEANEAIGKYLSSSKEPFLIGRSGVTECEVVCSYLLDKTSLSEKFRSNALFLSGISPNTDENLLAFSKEYSGALMNMDMSAMIFCSENYGRLVREFCGDITSFRLWGLEPYYFPDNPWSSRLEHKRVLVIHPFEKSIVNNYQNRIKLFGDSKILPEFDLLTLRAHQNLGDPHSNWFDSLNTMKQQILSIDFDVALIGCGAFGVPLGSFIKKQMGKSAIHMGGALQILFGVLGKRWENINHPILKTFINEYWTRPLPEETPETYKKVESGCYW
jgi:hypothetical protein